jgi:hypothetical protein
MSIRTLHIDKDWILENIESIRKLSNYEFIYYDDKFSYNFVNDMDIEQSYLRERLKSYTSGCPSNYIEYDKMKSLSESFISLNNKPNWIDIHFVKTFLNIQIDGNLSEQSLEVKKRIIKYYESK